MLVICLTSGIFLIVKVLAPYIRKKRKERKFLLKMKIKEDNEMRKKGWSTEIHHLFDSHHSNVFTFLLCLKIYEKKTKFKFPKYLKFCIIKDFVDNWDESSIEIIDGFHSQRLNKKNYFGSLSDSANELLIDYDN